MATALAATNHVAMVDLKGKVDPDWCPGCGDFGVLAAVQKALVELDGQRVISAAEEKFYPAIEGLRWREERLSVRY